MLLMGVQNELLERKRMRLPEKNLSELWTVLRLRDKAQGNRQLAVLPIFRQRRG
jgi:hypothetical protein